MFATGTVAATSDAEAVKHLGMVSTIHEVNQWGRKDPFTPAMSTIALNNNPEVQIYKADGIAITKGTNGIGTTDEHEFKYEARTTTNQTTINHLIQNPSTHYYKGDGTNQVPIATTEYYNTTKEGDWWNPTIKTIYDPCPNGYRIPELGTYDGLTTITFPWTGSGLTAGGVWTSASSFFPASGLRDRISSQFSYVSSGGFNWIATPYSVTSGYNLGYHYDKIMPSSTNYRSTGFPTRCIKE